MAELKYPAIATWFPKEDRQEILKAIEGILISGRMTQGRYLEEFEEACSRMAGTRYALGVNSGGTALELALSTLELNGGEVIVPTDTFVATPNSVLRAGGRPVFADISAKSLSLSLESIKVRTTPRTRGIILVHMFGLMSPEIRSIQAYCRKHRLFLLEDAAHAHGGKVGKSSAGSLGVAGCFSYYATKILAMGEGGSITTDDRELAVTVRSLRDHGRSKDGVTFDRVGNNFRLAEIPALLGLYQHRNLKKNLLHRQKLAAIYRELLKRDDRLTLIDPQPFEGHSYWRYPLLLNKQIHRARLQKRMAEKHGVRITWMYEPLCHQQPYYQQRKSYRGNFPIAEDVGRRLINLPVHWGINGAAAEWIAKKLQATLEVC